MDRDVKKRKKRTQLLGLLTVFDLDGSVVGYMSVAMCDFIGSHYGKYLDALAKRAERERAKKERKR